MLQKTTKTTKINNKKQIKQETTFSLFRDGESMKRTTTTTTIIIISIVVLVRLIELLMKSCHIKILFYFIHNYLRHSRRRQKQGRQLSKRITMWCCLWTHATKWQRQQEIHNDKDGKTEVNYAMTTIIGTTAEWKIVQKIKLSSNERNDDRLLDSWRMLVGKKEYQQHQQQQLQQC